MRARRTLRYAGYSPRTGASDDVLIFMEGGVWCYDQSDHPIAEEPDPAERVARVAACGVRRAPGSIPGVRPSSSSPL